MSGKHLLNTINEKTNDLEKYLEYQLLDAKEELTEDEYKRRKGIQWYFKKKYDIRLFECNSRDVYEKILEK